MKPLAKAVIVAGSTICFLMWALFWLAAVASGVLGLPAELNLPAVLRWLGGAMLGASLLQLLWLLRYRRPSTMIVSTYFTFLKMFGLAPVSLPGRRTEPLVITGPQQYLRHPLYLAATAACLGWGLVTGVTSSLVGVGLILLWFRLVQIPFEERELRAIFGEAYALYADRVPMLIPWTRPKPAGPGPQL